MDKELDFDEINDVADGMIPDSRIVKIIDEMELAKKKNLVSSEAFGDRHVLVEMF
ncbi:hypothetical protein [Nitrosomonas aestuarii]|uniref:hypothetical protein n=1 Tax=Nitrosomonas aestuarii TaxID=52441 RepID=UPI000D4A3A6D|nr:hypothetical protein [Nitrosomonas aestuarii]PTN11616.1 hypothetical protein C8R11_10835 [Nitrosomonas aestuarii]